MNLNIKELVISVLLVSVLLYTIGYEIGSSKEPEIVQQPVLVRYIFIGDRAELCKEIGGKVVINGQLYLYKENININCEINNLIYKWNDSKNKFEYIDELPK